MPWGDPVFSFGHHIQDVTGVLKHPRDKCVINMYELVEPVFDAQLHCPEYTADEADADLR